MSVRVRFAPSPTGSLHVGNALTAVANRVFADREGGVLVLRIDDTDEERTVPGGEGALLTDLAWLGIGWDEGPLRQSERSELYRDAAATALTHGAVLDPDGSLRLGGTTLVRSDGTATYQLATVADDLDLGITHIIRGSDHRPNEAIQMRIAQALGGELPEVIHHGLVLGDDGKKLAKRHGHASISDLRDDGFPPEAVRAYLDELGLPSHDVQLDMARLQRLAIDAIAALPDEELAVRAGGSVRQVPALRGARTLLEAELIARSLNEPTPVSLGEDARPTLERFVELREGAREPLDRDGAKAIVRELKAVGGQLKSVRLALTGAERGPELWAVIVALPPAEAIRRAHAAL